MHVRVDADGDLDLSIEFEDLFKINNRRKHGRHKQLPNANSQLPRDNKQRLARKAEKYARIGVPDIKGQLLIFDPPAPPQVASIGAYDNIERREMLSFQDEEGVRRVRNKSNTE